MVENFLRHMRTHGHETALLERQLHDFFDGVIDYCKLQEKDTHRGSLESAEVELARVESQRSAHVQDAATLEAKLDELTTRRVELERQLADLKGQESAVVASLQQARDSISHADELTTSHKETIARLRDAPRLSDEQLDSMRLMEEALEESRKELLELQPL